MHFTINDLQIKVQNTLNETLDDKLIKQSKVFTLTHFMISKPCVCEPYLYRNLLLKNIHSPAGG